MSSTTGKARSYNEYITLLFSSATTYDDQFKSKKVKRLVMLHDVQHDYNDYEHHYDDYFDIQCPVSTIQAFVIDFHPKNNSKPNSTKVRME
jgi:hypothetical protein